MHDNLLDIVYLYRKNNFFSGHIVIAKDGEVIFNYVDGFSNFENKANFIDNQLFHIASITKQFLSMLIMKLNEDNKLCLNDPISSYLNSSHSIWGGSLPDWANQITISNLLSNSSGIVNYIMDAILHPELWSDLYEANHYDIKKLILNKIKNMPLEFSPGSNFAYSNTNYMLLELIAIELINQFDLKQWFEENVFRPLNMQNTIWLTTEEELFLIKNIYSNIDLPKRYTILYHDTINEPKIVNSHGLNLPLGGAGCMLSSINDLLIWNNVLYSGELISDKSLKIMTHIHYGSENDPSLGKVFYGYGLMIDNIDNKTIYRHSGHLNGVRSHLSYDQNNNYSIVMLSNMSPSYEQDFDKINLQDKEQFDLISDLHKELFKLHKVER